MTHNQIQAAQRLVAAAEIQAVRLVEARAVHRTARDAASPSGGRADRRLQINLSHSGRASLKKGERVEAIVRFLLNARQAPAKGPGIVFRITASFKLIYLIPSELRPAAGELNAFSRTNAVFNAWPYWREFVQSMTSRMGLPSLTLPLFRITPIGRKE